MQIIIVTQTFPPRVGGMQSVMLALARGLSSQYQVSVYPDQYYRTSQFKVYSLPMNKLLRSFFKRLRISIALRRQDIVICDSWKSLAAVPARAQKVVVMAHGQEYLEVSEEKRRRMQALFHRVTHVVANSQATLAMMKAVVDIAHVKASVIPPTYGLKDLELTDPASQSSCRRLLSICRLEPRKGLQYVVEALGVLKNCADFEWSIVGQGEFSTSIRAMIEAAGLSNRVKLLGYVDEANKQQLLRSADVFVMPTYQEGRSLEGFGIAYVEAARYGVASIAGVSGGVKEAVIDGFTGWNVDPLNHKALTAVLREALLNHERTAQLGFNAQQHFREVMRAEVVLDDFLKHMLSEPVTA